MVILVIGNGHLGVRKNELFTNLGVEDVEFVGFFRKINIELYLKSDHRQIPNLEMAGKGKVRETPRERSNRKEAECFEQNVTFSRD